MCNTIMAWLIVLSIICCLMFSFPKTFFSRSPGFFPLTYITFFLNSLTDDTAVVSEKAYASYLHYEKPELILKGDDLKNDRQEVIDRITNTELKVYYWPFIIQTFLRCIPFLIGVYFLIRYIGRRSLDRQKSSVSVTAFICPGTWRLTGIFILFLTAVQSGALITSMVKEYVYPYFGLGIPKLGTWTITLDTAQKSFDNALKTLEKESASAKAERITYNNGSLTISTNPKVTFFSNLDSLECRAVGNKNLSMVQLSKFIDDSINAIKKDFINNFDDSPKTSKATEFIKQLEDRKNIYDTEFYTRNQLKYLIENRNTSVMQRYSGLWIFFTMLFAMISLRMARRAETK